MYLVMVRNFGSLEGTFSALLGHVLLRATDRAAEAKKARGFGDSDGVRYLIGALLRNAEE